MIDYLKRKTQAVYVSIYVIGVIGVVGVINENTRPFFVALAPYVSFVIGGYALLKTWKSIEPSKKRLFIIWCAFVFGITFLLEFLGVNYGIFGRYSYGSIFKIMIGGVPLAIEIDWILVILGLILILHDKVRSTILFAISVGLIAFVVDCVLIEPVAITFGAWKWEGGVPVSNYIFWFMVGFISALFFKQLNLKIKMRLMNDLWIANLLVFISLKLYFQL
ncbi:carotenoid biosynthesis protein [Thermoproteota archaeon]